MTSDETKKDLKDFAETCCLTEAIEEILPALEEFNKFQGKDLAGRQMSVWMEELDQHLPEKGVGLQKVLHDLAKTIIPYGVRSGAPGFSGWVTTGPTTSGVVAALAGTVAGSQRWWVQPFNYLEKVALRWLADLLQIPKDWQGTFASGGSIANLIGLGAARQWAFERRNHDPAREGLACDKNWRIYASSEVHHVVNRAASVLGLGRQSLASIAVDADLRMNLDHLYKTLKTDQAQGIVPIAIVATAGTVNSGAIDPIDQIAEISSEFDTWLHVDGAYGLFGILDARLTPLFQGLDRADSLTVDPHKWLAAPVGCGAVFVRDRALLSRTFTMESADYAEGCFGRGDARSPFDDMGEPFHNFNLEMSAPSRGVQVWAILREIGAEGMRERVVRHNDFARHLASRVEENDRLELLAPPILSICCFRYRPAQMTERELDALNEEIVRRLREDSLYVPSTTRIKGKLAIRPCYINPRTSLADVDGLVDRVLTFGDSLMPS